MQSWRQRWDLDPELAAYRACILSMVSEGTEAGAGVQRWGLGCRIQPVVQVVLCLEAPG